MQAPHRMTEKQFQNEKEKVENFFVSKNAGQRGEFGELQKILAQKNILT